ncbi:MAG TPA: SpoVR family protein, partial [Geobacteraceae bacterium]|nr:SpoVR family protein [Geobacteraceae bacterium]
EKGHWVDYIIEFARAIDNLVDYHGELAGFFVPENAVTSSRLDYYFDIFLQEVKGVAVAEYIREVNRYNDCLRAFGELAEKSFFTETSRKYPEFEVLFHKAEGERAAPKRDLLRYLMERSPFLGREENLWMKQILEIVRKTSVFFQPQIRTKIMNEGWASYWHEYLFLSDDRIRGHEVDFARVHAGVTAMPRVGTNPYALGMRLFSYLEEQADKGKNSFDYRRLKGTEEREQFDRKTGGGREHIFAVRENLCDYIFLKDAIDQEFLDRHNLFVVGKRLDQQRQVWQYYVKSRKAEDYRQMVLASLYHPPSITVIPEKGAENTLYLFHRFEGKQLVQEYIANTMMAIEYLWGGPVHLETSEAKFEKGLTGKQGDSGDVEGITWQRVVYRMDQKTLGRMTR